MVGFHLSDRGQHVPGDAVGAAGLAVEGQVAGWDGRGLAGGRGLGRAGAGLLADQACHGGQQQDREQQERRAGGDHDADLATVAVQAGHPAFPASAGSMS